MTVIECADDLVPLQAEYRRRRKEVQSQIQALKKNSSLNKKARKSEIQRLEADLVSELKGLDFHSHESGDSVEGCCSVTTESKLQNDGGSEGGSCTGQIDPKFEKSRVSRAQRRRELKNDRAKARLAEVTAQEDINRDGQRQRESAILNQLLANRGLRIHTVPSDGDCLFASVAHQLSMNEGASAAHELAAQIYDSDAFKTDAVAHLRSLAVKEIRSNPEDYVHYMVTDDADVMKADIAVELSSQDKANIVDRYCSDMEKKGSWGGHLELRALTQSLNVQISVIQAEGPTLHIGEGSRYIHLVVAFHRHLYSLGEHYNSCQPILNTTSVNDTTS